MDRRKFSITILSILWLNVICAASDVCTTKSCIHASAMILERIDMNADPCNDFYDFACGTFVQENYTPDESVAVDTFTKLRETIDAQVYTMLKDANDDEATPSHKLSKELFSSCLERDRNSEDDVEVSSLKRIINDLGEWPLIQGDAWDGTEWTLEKTITKMRKTLGLRSDKISDIASFIIKLENANNPSIRSSATFFSLRSAYSDYISKLAIFLGATGKVSDSKDELNHLLDFEYKFNSINLKYQQLSQPGDIKTLPDELLKKLFLVQWLDFFHPSSMKNIQPSVSSDDGKNSNMAEEFLELFNSTSSRTLANYVILRVVDFVAAQSITKLSDIYIGFQRLIDGRQDHEQRWKECIDMLSRNLPFAIGAVYIKRYVKPESKVTTMEMFNGIKDEFIELITNAQWIDESTREKLLYKLKSLVPLIAYPDVGFNEHAINEFYDDIKLDKSQYLRTLFQLRVIDADNKFRQTYTSTLLESSNDWKKYSPPTAVTAFYSESDNTIRLSAGVLQLTTSEAHPINYLDYGALGFIIAHEISHIVNQFFIGAESSNEKVQNEFAAKRRCVIEQYSGFREPETSQHLHGERIVIENIADNTGIKLAYRAYTKWNEKFNTKRESLIGLDFTWDQLFWLSAAQTWCGVYRKEELTRKIISDSYAPERFRVIGPLQNSPDFAKDFNCSQSSPMNRKNKCIIW